VTSGLEEAWDALLIVVPVGWYVGKPSYHDERNEWLLYAFDPSERAVVGVRSREWTGRRVDRRRCRLGDDAMPTGDCGGAGAEVGELPLHRRPTPG
jgi:hypothetical protein